MDRRASSLGLEVLTLRGGAFHMRAYGQNLDAAGDQLVIYLEGDGRPWIGGQHIADDPHGFETLALDLMQLDPRPAMYLERPCYHRSLARQDDCHPSLWTHGRYGETVVTSLAAAIDDQLAGRSTPPRVTLIGYSGGGVLAMLLAPRLQNAHHLRVVTIAANLDVDAWTSHHGYLPLETSLDPATEAPLPKRFEQLHLIGGNDIDVPAAVTRSGLAHQTNAEIVVFPDADHRCCWRDIWPTIMERTAASVANY